jgi:hypothetical protein
MSLILVHNKIFLNHIKHTMLDFKSANQPLDKSAKELLKTLQTIHKTKTLSFADASVLISYLGSSVSSRSPVPVGTYEYDVWKEIRAEHISMLEYLSSFFTIQMFGSMVAIQRKI